MGLLYQEGPLKHLNQHLTMKSLNYLREVTDKVSLVAVQNAFDLCCGGLGLYHFQTLEEHRLEINAEH